MASSSRSSPERRPRRIRENEEVTERKERDRCGDAEGGPGTEGLPEATGEQRGRQIDEGRDEAVGPDGGRARTVGHEIGDVRLRLSLVDGVENPVDEEENDD